MINWLKKPIKIKKSSNYTIDLYQGKQLLLLLQSNYPLIDSLLLINKSYSCYREQMEAGASFLVLIKQHANNDFMKHLAFFLTLLPLEKALSKSIEICDFSHQFKQKLMKQASYPCLIFILAFILLLFFLYFIFPLVMETFTSDQNLFNLLFNLKVFSHILMVLLLIVFINVILVMIFKAYRYFMMQFLSKIFKIIPMYCSYYYAYYLQIFMNLQIPTIMMFDYLKQHKDYWLNHLATKFDFKLKQGASYLELIQNECLFDNELKQMMNLIIHTSKNELIKTYFIQSDYHFQNFFKKLAIYIQLFTYSFVGIIVLVVFQIFMIPLSMLENF